MNRERWCIACSYFFFFFLFPIIPEPIPSFFCVHSMDPKYHIIFDHDDNDNNSLMERRWRRLFGHKGPIYTDNDDPPIQVRKRSQPFFEVEQPNLNKNV